MKPLAFLLLSLLLFSDIVTYVDESGKLIITNVERRRRRKKPRVFREVNSSIYDGIIREKAGKYGVDPSLVKAIIAVESGFNSNAVSRKGAIGLMQLMPETAEDYGAKNPFDPAQNIEAGVRYLNKLERKFSEIKLAVAAYNAGENAVERWGGIPPFSETRAFVRNVMKIYGKRVKTVIYRCIGKNGGIIISNSPPLQEECSGPVERIK